MDIQALLEQASGEATRLVDGVDEAALGEPTPCTEWDVRALLNHMTGVSNLFAVAIEKGGVTDEEVGEVMGGDCLGADFKASWHAAADRAGAAYRRDGVLDDTVSLAGFGEMPGQMAMSIALLDLTTHCADLAHATGQPMPAADVCEPALAIGTQMLAEHRDPRAFDPEQPVAAGASAPERLLAFTGRKI